MAQNRPPAMDIFSFAGDSLFVEASGNNLHRRATAPELQAHFAAAEDQPGHWYEAQLHHYGLKPSKAKGTAKMRLYEAVKKGDLAVPAHLLSLEADLKREWKAQGRTAKAWAKATATAAKQTAKPPLMTTGLSTSSPKPPPASKKRKASPEPATSNKKTKQTATTSAGPPRKMQTARRGGGTFGGFSGPIAGRQVQVEKSDGAKNVKKPIKDETKKPVKKAAENPTKKQVKEARITAKTQVKKEIKKPAKKQVKKEAEKPTKKQVKKEVEKPAKKRIKKEVKVEVKEEEDDVIMYEVEEYDEDESSEDGYDEDIEDGRDERDEDESDEDECDENGEDITRMAQPTGRRLGLLNGRYEIRCTWTSSSYYPEEDASGTLILTLDRQELWGSIQIAGITGVMHFGTRPFEAADDHIDFNWRGHIPDDDGFDEFHDMYYRSRESYMAFPGNGEIRGSFEYDPQRGNYFTFEGQRLPGQGTASEFSPFDMRRRWAELGHLA